MKKDIKNLGIHKNLYKNTNLRFLLNVFDKMSLSREFEKQVKINREKGLVKTLIYLSLGQESIPATISLLFNNPWILFQHRGHSHYLSFGGDKEKLVGELLGLKSGSNKGMGGSPPIQDFSKRIIGHSGLIGDHVPIACGLSMKIKKKEKVLCFFGDGAAEEDYVLASLGFAISKKLPILFICEDNNLSVLTTIKERRSWNISSLAKGLNMNSCDITDDPMLIKEKVNYYKNKLPALINIRTCRELWHEGTGSDGIPEWSRYELIRSYLKKKNCSKELIKIEKKNIKINNKLWQKQLQKL